jgi:carboxymethylenebutenolidase
MGQMIEFKTPDGSKAPGYLAEPANAKAPGVVVIQEWWGLNPQIKGVADRLAQAGYRALVPDLYRGRVTTKADEANHLMTDLDFTRAAQQDLRGALQHLKAAGSKAAVLGFCMGGALTIMGAVHLAEADAGVCYYGIPEAKHADPAMIRVPLQGHFAAQDDWCTPAAVNALEAKLKAGKVKYEFYRYPGAHGFFNEQRPEVYDPKGAKEAWDRTIAFLQAHL